MTQHAWQQANLPAIVFNIYSKCFDHFENSAKLKKKTNFSKIDNFIYFVAVRFAPHINYINWLQIAPTKLRKINIWSFLLRRSINLQIIPNYRWNPISDARAHAILLNRSKFHIKTNDCFVIFNSNNKINRVRFNIKLSILAKWWKFTFLKHLLSWNKNNRPSKKTKHFAWMTHCQLFFSLSFHSDSAFENMNI